MIHNYHSSDGPRNKEIKLNLVGAQNPAHRSKNSISIINQTAVATKFNQVNSVKNLPGLSQNTTQVTQKRISPLPNGDRQKKTKMKVYVFNRNEEKKDTEQSIDDSTVTPQHKISENKLTEENNRLIEQMFKDRKRQYSCTTEMNSAFKSKLLGSKRKPKRRVIRKIVSRDQALKNSKKSNLLSVNESTESTSNQKTIEKSPDLTKDTRQIEQVSSSIFQKKQLEVKTSTPNLCIPDDINSAPLENSTRNRTKKPLKIVFQKSRKVESALGSPLKLLSEAPSTLNMDLLPTETPKKTTEELIAQSMADLAKINEENSVSEKSSSHPEDPSPKITVGVADTWGKESRPDDTYREIMRDIGDLELKYRLRENWMETQTSQEKPFPADVSAIFTTERKQK